MGLLDDAIREHLELKRQHGATDEEIAQKEAEALGPARRNFPMPPAGEPQPAPEPQPEPIEPAAHDLSARTAAPFDEPRPLEHEPEPVPFEDAPASEDDEEDLERPQGSEDVLEDTPEFLQDAPEHDRLWFEQRAPRDFDFD